MKSLRPTRWQEILRQWILLIPLATAVVGTLAISAGRDEIWIEYLPPLFFVGALLVTAAMLHQRHMLNTNWQLNGQLQGANERLDMLHHLTVDLNESLELDSVLDAVLRCAQQALDTQAGALWLRMDLLPSEVQKSAVPSCIPVHAQRAQKVGHQPEKRHQTMLEPAAAELMPPQWCCIAARGFEDYAARLADWDDHLESGQWTGEILAHGLLKARATRRGGFEVGDLWQDTAMLTFDDELSEHAVIAAKADGLGHIFAGGEKAAVVPILWKNEVVGALLSASWKASSLGVKRARGSENVLRESDVLMLRDIALMAGPSLQNSLHYGAATSRAQIDALTGLHNHRVLQERLTQEVARVTRVLEARPLDASSSVPLSVAVMDVTDFKLFNDTYGHSTGDNVLKFIASCLSQTFRTSDVVARYGGDEFVVVLPDTSLQSAQSVCRRAQEAVLSRPFEAPDGSQVSVRVSCGVAVFPSDGRDASTLLAKADERLYEAKAQGRLIVENVPPTESDSGGENGDDQPGIWREFPVYKALVEAIDKKDRYTHRHTRAVFDLATRIATLLQLPPAKVAAVQGAALLHDIGKIVVPDAILRKPGRLSEEETEIMQRHVLYGEQLVKDVPEIESVLEGVRHHHENFDGSGYPAQQSGAEIPFVARLLAVPDAFVAMTIERPYRRALSRADALRQIEAGSGTQFDPEIVRAFAEVVRNEV